jgi:hypothetical protein
MFFLELDKVVMNLYIDVCIQRVVMSCLRNTFDVLFCSWGIFLLLLTNIMIILHHQWK